MLIAPRVEEELYICDLDCCLTVQFLRNECNTDWPINVNMEIAFFGCL